jgi:hypothetical protein
MIDIRSLTALAGPATSTDNAAKVPKFQAIPGRPRGHRTTPGPPDNRNTLGAGVIHRRWLTSSPLAGIAGSGTRFAYKTG